MERILVTAPDPQSPLTRGMQALGTRVPALVGCAVVLLAAGLFVPQPAISATLLILGVLVAVIAVASWFARAHIQPNFEQYDIDALIEHDGRALLVADLSGRVIKRNIVAKRMFGDIGGESLEQLFDLVCQHANAVVFRLQAKAVRQHAAREDVVTRKGRYIIATHQIAPDRLLWAVEEAVDTQTVSRSVEKISLPMLTAGSSGTILFMNDAMRRLAGG